MPQFALHFCHDCTSFVVMTDRNFDLSHPDGDHPLISMLPLRDEDLFNERRLF